MSAVVNHVPINSPFEGIFLNPLTVPRISPQFSLTVNAADLFQLDAPLCGEPVRGKNQIEATFRLDKHVVLVLTLIGNQTKGGTEFRANRYLLNCKRTEPHPRAQFIRSSVVAIMGFAGSIDLKVPNWGVDTHLIFDLPLREISNQLQNRQLAYRLMVIEKAIGKRFSIPEITSAQEIEFTNRVYRAITERSFIGPIDPSEHTIPAVVEGLEWLDSYGPRQKFGPLPINSNIFGQTIPLGNATIVADDVFVADADETRKELAKNDGHLVNVVISSASGQGLYQTPEAPTIKNQDWDPLVNTLLSLEDQLSDTLAQRYQSLAALTLDGLTEEQKAEITARPELDAEAFWPLN